MLAPRTVRSLVLVSTLALAATTTVAVASSRPQEAAARVVPTEAPAEAVTADGRITDMLRMGERIYVRGSFSKLGAYSGSGMPVDPETGERVTAPLVDGQISVAVPDGAGGWYVGGDFREIGDVATRGLAHLGPDGTADPDFTHDIDGLVSAMDLHDGTLWIGGIFSHVDGLERPRLAAISTVTGEPTAFTSPETRWVTELVHAEADGDRPARVYVGTDRVVALDPETGAPDETFTSDLRGDVRALLDDGDRVLVGGPGLVALDADTGAVDPGFGLPEDRFPATTDGRVHTLLRDGARLYAGGDFDSLGGVAGPLVALDAATGLGDDGFTTSISELTYASSDRGVFDLALAGGHLWVGGSFARVEGSAAGNLVALDPLTGARIELPTPAYDNGVNAVDASGDGLYVGGQYFMTDPVHAPGFAALDAETLLPVASFGARRSGYGRMVAGDDVVYVGFTNFEGYSLGGRVDDRWYWPTKDRIHAVDAETGAARADLTLRGVKNLSGITTIDGELYVAQRLENDLKFPHTRISVYSQTTGERTRRFRLPLKGYVTELNNVDGRLIAAGSFRRFRASGQPAHLAVIEVSPTTGKLNPEFDLHTHGPVGEVEVHDGDLYVTGLFKRVYGGVAKVQRPGLARFDRSPSGYTGLVHEFDPPASLRNRRILRLLGLGDSLLVLAYGSLFLDADSGGPLPDPTGGYEPQVDAAVADPDGLVYSAHTWANLAGKGGYDLGFVARATD